jgi:hypothetical protein
MNALFDSEVAPADPDLAATLIRDDPHVSGRRGRRDVAECADGSRATDNQG